MCISLPLGIEQERLQSDASHRWNVAAAAAAAAVAVAAAAAFTHVCFSTREAIHISSSKACRSE